MISLQSVVQSWDDTSASPETGVPAKSASSQALCSSLFSVVPLKIVKGWFRGFALAQQHDLAALELNSPGCRRSGASYQSLKYGD